MEKPRRTMDVVSPATRPRLQPTYAKISRKGVLTVALSILFVALVVVGSYIFFHRNDQRVMADRYQVVYLVTGQIYFGKLQNTSGQYMTLKNAYTVQAPSSSSNESTGSVTAPSKILKVSQQVYGPDDSMAIRSDQVQFWQNLQPDSKVVKAIESSPGQ